MAWEGHDVYELQKTQKLSQLTIADLLESHELVWRSCIVDGIPSLLPSLRAKDYPDHVQGRLSVIVVRADGLSKPALSTSIRPYVVLEVGNMELRSSKKKANETGGVTWNEIFEFPIDFDLDDAPKDNEDYLIVNVFHKYYRLGRCLIAIKELSSIFRSGRKFILPPVSLNDAASIVSRGADGMWKSPDTTSASWYPLGKNEYLTEPAGFIQLEFSFAPGVEEEPHHVRWQPDTDLVACPLCHIKFTMFLRKHHCRKCGSLVCGECSQGRMIITRNNTNARKRNESGTKAVRVCDLCEPNKSMRTALEKERERAVEQLARIRKLSTWEPVDKRQLKSPNMSEEDDSDEKSNADSEIVGRMGSYALDLDSNREAYICECGRVCTYDTETNLRDFAARMRDTGEMPPLPTGSPRERWAWVSSVMGLKDSVDFSSRISLPEPPSESPARSRPSAERYSDMGSLPPPSSLPTGSGHIPPSPHIPPPSRSPVKRKPTIVKLNFGQICVCGRVIISATRPQNRNSTYHHPTRSRSIVASSHPAHISTSPLDPLNPATNLSSSPSLSASSLASSLSSSPASFSSPLASSSSSSSASLRNLFSTPSTSTSCSSTSPSPHTATPPRTPPTASMPLSSPPSGSSTLSPSMSLNSNSSSSNQNNFPNVFNNKVNNNNNNNTVDNNLVADNESRQRQLEKPWQASLRSTSATPSVSASTAPLVVASTAVRPKRTTTTSPAPRSDRVPPDSSSSPSTSSREHVPDGRSSFTMGSAPGKSPPPPPAVSDGSKTLKPLRPARGQGDESLLEPVRLKKSAYATLGAIPSSQQPLARHSKKQSLPPEPDGGPDRAAYTRKDSEQVLPPSWSPGIKR